MACNLSKTATTTQVHSGGGGDKAVRDEGYFWNRVTGLDTHHQTAVLALKHQAMFPPFTSPNICYLPDWEAGSWSCDRGDRVFSLAGEVDMKITQAE